MENNILHSYEFIKSEFRQRVQKMESITELIDFLIFDLGGETPRIREYINCMYIFNGCFGMENSEKKFNTLVEILDNIHDNFKFNVDMDLDLCAKDITISFKNDFIDDFYKYCRNNYNDSLDFGKIGERITIYDIKEIRSPEIFLNLIEYYIGENYIKDNIYRITFTQLYNVYRMYNSLEVEQGKYNENDTTGFLYAATDICITNKINKMTYKFGKTVNTIKSRMSSLSVGHTKKNSYKCIYSTEVINNVERAERILKILAEPLHIENEGEEYYTNYDEIIRVFTAAVKINNVIENNINEKKVELMKKYEEIKGNYEKSLSVKEELDAIKGICKRYNLTEFS